MPDKNIPENFFQGGVNCYSRIIISLMNSELIFWLEIAYHMCQHTRDTMTDEIFSCYTPSWHIGAMVSKIQKSASGILEIFWLEIACHMCQHKKDTMRF